MATFGSSIEDYVECLTEWPLGYVPEKKKFICGWCAHVLPPLDHEHLEKHFESCKNTKENGLVMGENNSNRNQESQIKTEVMVEETEAEIVPTNTKIEKENKINETEVNNKEISDIRKDLETEIEQLKRSGKASDTALSTLFRKINLLEEKMREMGVAQEERLKQKTEALWVHLKRSEGDIGAIKTGLEQEVAHLKTTTETLSKQLQTNDRDCRLKKRQSKKKEPFSADQMTLPMNCFNLVTQNHLFAPIFKWTIDDIESITAHNTWEMRSRKFRLKRYPVKTRAKLQLKEDDCVYMSLSFEDESEAEEDLRPIPTVYYMLRARNSATKHMCFNMGYLFTSEFRYSFDFNTLFCHKTWLDDAGYNVDDSVKIEIYVEHPMMMTQQQAHSYDGTLEWNMEHYKRRLQFEKEQLVPYQESPYFYTGPNGYRVQVRMSLNGDGDREGPCAHILFWMGEFDDKLPQSFPHSTTVTLMNRKNPERSISKTIVKDIQIKKEYELELCKLEDVENVIENDTLFCKVVIKSH